MDPLVAILDGYTVYGGGAVDPPAMFFEWLRDHRAHQTVTPRALAPDHLETANWCGGTDRHLMRLHTSAGLLREELAQLDRILERTEHEPTAESVEAMLRGLESAGIFLRQAYRALGMEMVQEPPELLQ
ncbi:hypothetical protein ACOPJQ_02435 [Luteimonas dalianensis]|uniref:hypothetical protein n=1 Tax=Luteimonas dalianensis TaxID=1148196 RepID=UPI003BF180EF